MHPIEEDAPPCTPHYPQHSRQAALQLGQNGDQSLQQGQDQEQPPADHAGLRLDQAGNVSPLLEAVLGHNLSHPNIVRTYQYATQATKVSTQLALYCLRPY